MHQHDIHTSLVPLDDEAVDPAASPMQAAGLCPAFRDSGVPFFWDRLASRGVVRRWDSRSRRSERFAARRVSVPRDLRGVKDRPQRMLAAFEKLDELVPDYRFTAGWLPLRSATKPFDDDEPIDGDDGADEGGATPRDPATGPNGFFASCPVQGGSASTIMWSSFTVPGTDISSWADDARTRPWRNRSWRSTSRPRCSTFSARR